MNSYENFYINIFNNLLKEEQEHNTLHYIHSYPMFFQGRDMEKNVSDELWDTFNLKCLYQLSLQNEVIKNNIDNYETFLLKVQAIKEFPMIEN